MRVSCRTGRLRGERPLRGVYLVLVRGDVLGLALLGGDACLWDVLAGFWPVLDEVIDYDVADAVGVVECGQIGAVLADFGFGEALGCGDADALLIEVGGSAEYEHAVNV